MQLTAIVRQTCPFREKGGSLVKIMRVMRLTVILMLCACLHVSAGGFSQQITLNEKKASLSKIFREVYKQTGFEFIYNADLLKTAKHVSIRVRNAPLQEVLALCFRDQPLTFTIQDKAIVVTKTAESANTTAAPAPVPEMVVIDIRGRVLDEKGDPVEAVSVNVKGTNISVQTDADGRFSISFPGRQATLVFSHVSFVTQEKAVSGSSAVDVSLVSLSSDLHSVVVVGYGVAKKRDLTGSVSQVTTEELEAVPVFNVEQALKGRAAGVRVTNNSGAPNSRVQVHIRGGNSMIGDNSPLYVVDGFPITGGLQFLNPSDIESMDILKDASSTAIYGSRGANGVVIITTKRGRQGQKGKIDISSYWGMQEVVKKYDVLDAKQYATIANEWSKNEGLAPVFDIDEIEGPGTDWQAEVMRKAPLQNHTITFSGAGNKSRYSFSANYYDQDGILINNSVRRGSLVLNLDHELNERITLGVNLSLSRREGYSTPVDNSRFGLVTGALSVPPTLPVYDDNGVLTRTDQIYAFGNQDDYNPLRDAAPRKTRFLATRGLTNGFLEIKLIDNLKFRSQLGLEYENTINEDFVPIIWPGDLGSASDGYAAYNSFLNENVLSYSTTIRNVHQLNVVAGFTYQTYMNRFENSSVRGLANNFTDNYNLASASIIDVPSNGISEWKLLSWLGRINYTLKDKYLFTASVRRDGSSRFGANNKWAIFPSGAFAWRISNEPFMESVTFIDDLKLRTSYGITGSTALNPYQTIDRLNSNRVVEGNNTPVVGYAPGGLANPDLKWETTAQFDIGFDLSILRGRIDFTFDYYKKNTSDLLATVILPPSVGFASVLQNVGEIENKGVEFSVNADVLTKEFKWNVGLQFSANRNKVVSIAGSSDIFGNGNGHPFNSPINIGRVGQPLGVFYGYIEDGLDDEGQIKYVDVDGNGVVNALDRVILGNPYPDFIFGFNNRLSYKNFELDFFFEGVQGNDIFWETAAIHLNSFQRGTNQFVDIMGNYWIPEKPDPNAKYPKISSSTPGRVSDRYVKDGSYIRLKSLRLAYNLPTQNLEWCNRAQIFISGTNLITITNYPGIDPEVNVAGTDSQNIGSRLMVGIDKSPFPLARVISVGINASF